MPARLLLAPAGKGVWGKGYTELLDLLHEQRSRGDPSKSLDVYGSGEDIPEVILQFSPWRDQAGCFAPGMFSPPVMPAALRASDKDNARSRLQPALLAFLLEPWLIPVPSCAAVLLARAQACCLAAHDTQAVGIVGV